MTQHRTEHPEKALEWLRKGEEAFPRSAALRHRTGRVLLQLKRPDEAVKELEEAIRLDPRFLDARLALGLAEQARGRREPAREALEEVRKLSPTLIGGSRGRGSAGTAGDSDVDGALTMRYGIFVTSTLRRRRPPPAASCRSRSWGRGR